MDFANLPQTPAQFTFGSETISLDIPDANWIFENYQEHNDVPFPYWTKIWPAAFALANWMIQHKALFHQKKVLELGAGLALPSLLASRWSHTVITTDNDERAIEFLNQNLQRHPYPNVRAKVLDWCSCQPIPAADILLLADVNYSPAQFEPLLQLLHTWQLTGKGILLTTPHRLSGRPFLERLLALGFQTTELPESIEAPGVSCSLFTTNVAY